MTIHAKPLPSVMARPRPWEAGKGQLVIRHDYVPGAMVAVAPGGQNLKTYKSDDYISSYKFSIIFKSVP